MDSIIVDVKKMIIIDKIGNQLNSIFWFDLNDSFFK